MNWNSIAITLGRFIGIVSHTRQLRDGRGAPPRRRAGGVWATLALLLALPVYAAAQSPTYFADGLTDQSSWEEILKRRGVRAEFPHVAFGSMFVSLRSLCLDGDMLAIADRRIDNGLQVSADSIGGRGQARAATGASSAARVGASGRSSSDAGSPPRPPDQPNPPLTYSVDVYRIIETGLSPTRVLLFRKAWEVPACQGQ